MAGPRIHARRSDPAVGRRRHAAQLFHVYPYLLHDLDTMRVANRCVLETLAEWLPSVVDLHHQPTPASVAPLTARPDQGLARGYFDTEQRVRIPLCRTGDQRYCGDLARCAGERRGPVGWSGARMAAPRQLV